MISSAVFSFVEPDMVFSLILRINLMVSPRRDLSIGRASNKCETKSPPKTLGLYQARQPLTSIKPQLRFR